METVILDGGPSDGKRITIGDGTSTVTAVTAPPVPIVIAEPKPPWWRFIRRLRWRPPPPPPQPKAVQLSYRDSGDRLDGLRVFRLGDGWQPYRGPEISGDGNLYKELVTALYAAHPMLRLGSAGTRWVMDLEWYRRVRAEARQAGSDPDGDDPDEWTPDPKDLLIGIPVSVTGDGGRPHLENARYPAGWPSALSIPVPWHPRSAGAGAEGRQLARHAAHMAAGSRSAYTPHRSQ